MKKSCNNRDCSMFNILFDDEVSLCPLCEQPLMAHCNDNELAVPFGETTIEEVELVAIYSRNTLKIPLGGCVIGRLCGIGDGFFDHTYVSDPHCRLFIENNTLYVEDIGDHPEGSTNGTYIDGGDRLPKNTPTSLAHGSRLAISKYKDFKFDVRIKRSAVRNPDVVEEKNIWVVICKRCGAWYRVGHQEEKIQKCESCTNPSDARDISRRDAVIRSEEEWKLHT